MDEKSIEILEFPDIKERLSEYTSFPAGHEMALNLKPVSDYEKVSLWLRQSTESMQLLSLDPHFTISGAADISKIVEMAALGRIIEPIILCDIQNTLGIMRNVRSSLYKLSEKYPLLWDIAKYITELPNVEKEIKHCLSPNGEVLNRASQNLAGIRSQLRAVRQTLKDNLTAIINTPNYQRIIQDPIITERGGRYVISVKTEARREIEGITHDVSNTGATVFVEPVVTMEMGNTLRELISEEKREIERILRNLSMRVGTYEAEILISISKLAELDLALAKAKYARDVKACEPKLTNFSDTSGGNDSLVSIKLVNARHPLLGQKAVPISIELGRDYSTLIITGPNTGGKTVALKTIGLLSLMTQAGIPIPASPETCLPVFDSVFTDIGDEQSIEQTLSSFSWHIMNIVRIIKHATGRSLVLLDELGTSTDPAEGSALARSILLHFHSLRILTVATTHYRDLKAFAHVTPGVQNASFDFAPVTLRQTYHLTLGMPGGSNALATAERLGISPVIINEARAMLSKGTLDLDATLSDIMEEKQRIETTREILEKEKDKAEAFNNELENRIRQIRTEEQQIIQEARDRVVRNTAELHRQIRQVGSELRKKRTREQANLAKKNLADIQKRLDSRDWTPRAAEMDQNQTISVGDTVYLRDINLKGTVLFLSEGKQTVEVQAGQVKLNISINNVGKIANGTNARQLTPAKIILPKPVAISNELNLRGKRASEIEVLLDAYLNNTTLANLNKVFIIHGIGTGTVRQIVRDFLTDHQLVKSFRVGKQEEGGDGVTVVNL